jgi:FtsX-like permease family
MKLNDTFKLGIKKLKYNIGQSLYLLGILTVSFSLVFSVLQSVSGTSTTLRSGLLLDNLANKNISWKIFESKANNTSLNLTQLNDNVVKNTINNIYTAQKYSMHVDKYLAVDINFPDKPSEKSNINIISFLDDELFKNQIGKDTIPSASDIIPFLVPLKGVNSNDSFLSFKRILSQSNLPLESKLITNYKINDETPLWQKKLEFSQSTYKFELVGKYVGAMAPVDQVIVPLSYKQRIFDLFQKEIPDANFELTELHGFYNFKTKENQKEFESIEGITFPFQSPTNSFNNQFYGFEYLSLIFALFISIIALLLIVSSIKKSLVNNSQLLAILECFGARKIDIFLINLSTVLPIFVISVCFSLVISTTLKYFIYQLLNSQGLFYFFYGELNKLDWEPSSKLFMEFSVKDFQVISGFVLFLFITIVVGIFLTIKKIKVIESLKE